MQEKTQTELNNSIGPSGRLLRLQHMKKFYELCNIKNMIHCWAHIVVHLLLPKSSLVQLIVAALNVLLMLI